MGINAEGYGLRKAESANLDQTRSVRAKMDGWTDYLIKKRPKLELILIIYVRGFELCPLSEVILYRLSFGGMLAVRCSE